MKTFFTVLAVIACWVIIYGNSLWLVLDRLCVLMAVREREIEELKMRKNNGSKQ